MNHYPYEPRPALLARLIPLAAGCFLALMVSACTTQSDSQRSAVSDHAIAERGCRVRGSVTARMARQTCQILNEWTIIDAKAAQQAATQDEYSRRMLESSMQQQGPAFDSPAAAGY